MCFAFFICSEVTTFASVQAAFGFNYILYSLIFASWNKQNLNNLYKRMSHEIDQLEFKKDLYAGPD